MALLPRPRAQVMAIFSSMGLLLRGGDSAEHAEDTEHAAMLSEAGLEADGAGVKRLAEALRVHSSSLDILESGCHVIGCLAQVGVLP